MLNEEEKCYFCDRKYGDVKLFDAISGEEIIKICESCSFTEDIPIIKKPSSIQLKEAERPYTVYERLARSAGLGNLAKEKRDKEIETKTAQVVAKGITLDNLRKPRDFRRVGDSTVEMIRVEKPINLVDNYHWYLQRARRARGLTIKQLADAIGEAEITVKMIEYAQLPSDYEKVLRKIQQFLRVDFEKGKFFADRKFEESQPIKAEETSNIIESEDIKKEERPEKKDAKRDIINQKHPTIYDLYKIKEAREKGEREKKLKDEIKKGGMDSLNISDKDKAETGTTEENTTEYEEKKSFNIFKKIFSRKKKEEEVDLGVQADGDFPEPEEDEE